MLWFPTKAWRKETARLTRRRRRRRMARLLLFGFIVFGVVESTVPPDHILEVELARIPHQFHFWDWESAMLTEEVGRQLYRRTWEDDLRYQQTVVEQYIEHEKQIAQLKHDIKQIYATSDSPQTEATSVEQTLRALKTTQAKLIPQVEAIVAQQVETILREEGLSVAGVAFPPVAFRLVEPPTFLIISNREQINRINAVPLQPGLTIPERATLEARLDERGDISSYVTNIGGLGSYPAMVVRHGDLPFLIEVVIHEWVHNYFFTVPSNMAWGYTTYPKLRTINETVASLVGKELNRTVIERYYPAWVERLPPLDAATKQPQPYQPSEYDLSMRRIRRNVDQLLANGYITRAEAYMEHERQRLVAQGHNLRKLNQAYFAFHGAYTLNPASIDPTGQQIRTLRANSPSLKAFLERVSWLNHEDDYFEWLAEEGITSKE